MDSMFSASIWPLLPVSIAEMPSIMMLFWPAPPMRVPPAEAPPACTPGVNCVRLVKLPWLIGRFSICSVEIAKDRSALCDCTSGGFGGHVHGFGGAADFERQRRDRHAVAAADLDALPAGRS